MSDSYCLNKSQKNM